MSNSIPPPRMGSTRLRKRKLREIKDDSDQQSVDQSHRGARRARYVVAFAAAPGESSRAEERTQLGDCENSDGLPVTQDTDPNFDKKKEAWRFISSRVQVLSESSSDGEEQDEPAQTYERYSTREMNREDRQDGYQVENGTLRYCDASLELPVFKKMRLFREAKDLYEKLQYQAADQRSLELLDVARCCQDSFFQALALLLAGRSQYYMEDYEASLHSFERMRVLPQDSSTHKTVQGWAYNGIGCAYEKMGQYNKAIEYAKVDLCIKKQLNDRPGEGRAYGNLGKAFDDMGLYKAAIENFEKELDIKQQLNDKPGQGLAHRNLGSAYYGMGLYKVAIENFKRDLDIKQQLNDEVGQGRAYCNMGNACSGLGNHKEAIEYHQKHLDIAHKLKDEHGQGRAYCNMGNALNNMGLYKQAIDFHHKDFDIADKLDDDTGRGRAYCNLGNTFSALGDHKRAIEYFNKDLDIAERLNDRSGQGAAYSNLGNAHAGLGEYKEAINYLQKWMKIASALDVKPFVIDALKRFGRVYLEMGDLKQAADYFTQLKVLAEELELEVAQCSAYSGLGSTYLRMGKHKDALKYHQEELRIAKRLGHGHSLAQAYSGLGCVYTKLEKYKRAIKYHEKDRTISKRLESRSGQKRAYGNLGDVYKHMNDYEKAIGHHQTYLEMAKELKDKPAQIRAHGSLGLERFRDGNPALAFRHFTKFEDLLNELEEQLTEGQWRQQLAGFVENYAEYMDAWVMAAAQQGDMLAALRAEEWRRCRSELPYLSEDGGGNSSSRSRATPSINAMRDVTAGGLEGIARSVDASFITVFKVLEGKLMTWVLSGETGKLVYKRLVDLKKRKQKVQEWVDSVTFAKWAKWQQAFKTVRQWTIREDREGRSIREEDLTNIVERTIPNTMKGDLDEDLWASIRNPRTFLDTVSGLGESFEVLKSHFLQKAEDAIKKLSNLLLKPILKECPGFEESLQGDVRPAKPIYFLPDSTLSPIPFYALKIGERFLIEKALVAQAASLRTLYHARVRSDTINKERRSPSEALVISYEDSPSAEFHLLEYIEELNQILPADIISDSYATSEEVIRRVTKGSASLIHYVGHGASGDREKNWAGISLAFGEVLSASELHKRFTKENLSPEARRTRLMVLCACSSGLGHCMSEGVHGFARAALAGGIPCLLATKWNIPAKESIILMTRVYAFMAMNKESYMTVAEALQAAIVSLLKDKDTDYKCSFYYWAAFISHGFASIKLDDALLDKIHNQLMSLKQASGRGEASDSESALKTELIALTQNSYHVLGGLEQALSSEWSASLTRPHLQQQQQQRR